MVRGVAEQDGEVAEQDEEVGRCMEAEQDEVPCVDEWSSLRLISCSLPASAIPLAVVGSIGSRLAACIAVPANADSEVALRMPTNTGWRVDARGWLEDDDVDAGAARHRRSWAAATFWLEDDDG